MAKHSPLTSHGMIILGVPHWGSAKPRSLEDLFKAQPEARDAPAHRLLIVLDAGEIRSPICRGWWPAQPKKNIRNLPCVVSFFCGFGVLHFLESRFLSALKCTVGCGPLCPCSWQVWQQWESQQKWRLKGLIIMPPMAATWMIRLELAFGGTYGNYNDCAPYFLDPPPLHPPPTHLGNVLTMILQKIKAIW